MPELFSLRRSFGASLVGFTAEGLPCRRSHSTDCFYGLNISLDYFGRSGVLTFDVTEFDRRDIIDGNCFHHEIIWC